MALKTFIKDPSSVLDYRIDWTDWLQPGDTISTSNWTVPAGISKDSNTNDTVSATIWLSGGTAGNIYNIVCRIVTAVGRTDERSLDIKVEER
jgi:hypothetical protein